MPKNILYIYHSIDIIIMQEHLFYLFC